MTDSTVSDAQRPPAGEPVPPGRENVTIDQSLPATESPDDATIDLARIAWAVTVIAFLTAGVVLSMRGDLGYAGVTFAVAASAAINLV